MVLLLLAATDMLVPGLCLAETPPSSSGDVSSRLPLNRGGDDVDADDCYCCCAHVVPRDFAFSGRAAEEVWSLGDSPRQVPVGGSTLLDHPPRV